MATKDSGIVNIHGKEYQTVAYRIDQFRQKYLAEQGWSVLTEIISADADVVRMKAMIVNNGHVFATGHAEEYRADGKINKTSALENAETSAIGRALACFGLGGTEFASADEVARAVSGQKPAAPAPLDVEAVCEAMNAADTVAVLTKYMDVATKRGTSEQIATIKPVYEQCKAQLEAAK